MAERTDPDADDGFVSQVYAGVMWQVQGVEMLLTSTYLLKAVEKPTGVPTSAKGVQRHILRALRAVTHAKNVVSIADKIKALRPILDEDLITELERFKTDRNFLAHRFILESMHPELPGFREGTLRRLGLISIQNDALGERLRAINADAVAALPEPTLGPPEALQSIAHWQITGDVTGWLAKRQMDR